MNVYIFSQVIVMFAYIICGIGFLKKEKLQILYFSTIFSILILIQYMLLNAYSGILACTINIFRNLLFIFNIKNNKRNSELELILLCSITILCTIFLYKTLFDLIPMILAIVGIFSYWNSNTKILRICNLICSLCYILYAIPFKSLITIICEIYLIVTTSIGIFKHENRSKSRKKGVI